MIRCVLIGAGGYTGSELVGMMLAHPRVQLVGLFGSSDGDRTRTFSDVHTRFRGRCDLPIVPTDVEVIASVKPDAIFLCTPHDASASLVGSLMRLIPGCALFDLSAAFRLSEPTHYERFYGFTHPNPDLLAGAVYGLAERRASALAGATLVAVPGCYPTSVVLPLAPLVESGAINQAVRPIADCTSGVSGAGRTPTGRNAFCEVSAHPYGVWTHRHRPEIREHTGADVVFTPHLGPYERGILSTIHVELADGWDELRVRETLVGAYADAPFVRLLDEGTWPTVKGVERTNFCDIALACEGSHAILCSAIDNLVKGASGQALQCMNIRFGLDQTLGLLPGGSQA